MKVEFYRHNIGVKEIKDVSRTLHSLFLTTADVTSAFEKRFANYLGCKRAVGVNSCTEALHLSLYALGIGPGDEVITTPLSFYATANAILYVGAKPIFVDVEKDTGLIATNLIEKAITNKTKAIIPVHMYGQMCDMKKLHQIAKRHKLKVIEDAALCIEGKREGIRPGQLSDSACFSFHAIKSITSGEGGAIVTNNKSLAKRLKLLRLHGISKTFKERHQDKKKRQDMIELGLKCNMYDIQASLLLNQLKRITFFLKRRSSIYKQYEKELENNPKIFLPYIKKHSKSAKTMFVIWVDPKIRNKYLINLQEFGIGVDIKYHPIHLSTYYKKRFGFKTGAYPIAERISNSTITLPLYPKLKNSEVNYIIHCLNKITRD